MPQGQNERTIRPGPKHGISMAMQRRYLQAGHVATGAVCL